MWRRRNKDGRGERRWHRSKPDYFMTQGADRKRFRRCRWVLPPTHNSDHRALVAKIATEGGIKEFRGGGGSGRLLESRGRRS